MMKRKNENLKKAFTMLDKEYLDSIGEAPKEELYFSEEYLKNEEKWLKKQRKPHFSPRVFAKRAAAFVLGVAVGASAMILIPRDETVPPVSTETTFLHKAIDFSDTDFVATSTDTTATGKKLGFSKGTYEYDYFEILSEISLYTRILQVYTSEGNRESQLKNRFVSGYFETVDIEAFFAPCDDIYTAAGNLLLACDFSPAALTFETFNNYYWNLPYEVDRVEVATVLGARFSNANEKLLKAAEKLLALPEKYPTYDGEYALTGKIRDLADTVIKHSSDALEQKGDFLSAWLAFYETMMPTLEIKEEFIPALDAVKITIGGNGKYRIPEIAARYVENYQYEVITTTSGRRQDTPIPTDEVVLYMPTESYVGMNPWDRELEIHKYDEDGNVYFETVNFLLDPTDYYSDAPITLECALLDEAMREIFGGDYSEKDLLTVQGITLYPWLGMTVYIMEDGEHVPYRFYEGITLEEEPEALYEALSHLHALYLVQCRGANSMDLLTEAEIESLLPYHVTDESTITLN